MKLTKARALWPAIVFSVFASFAAKAVEMVPIPPPEAPADGIVDEQPTQLPEEETPPRMPVEPPVATPPSRQGMGATPPGSYRPGQSRAAVPPSQPGLGASPAPSGQPAPSYAPSPTQPQAFPGKPSRTPSSRKLSKAPRADEMLFNFQNADVAAVVRTMAEITGRNFLIDPRVKGNISIISTKPVSKAAAYEIFVSALKAQGFTAIEGPGGIVKIVPEAEAKQGATVQAGARASDKWITQVVVVENASATQLVPLLRPLMSAAALLSVYAPGNVLVMTDTASTIRNVLQVISEIDRQGRSDITIIPLQHTSAADMAQMIGRFSDAQIGVPGQGASPQGADQRLIVVPDLRTNGLIVRAANPARLAEVRALVAKLDVPARAGGTTHVVYLRYAEAKKLADILRGLIAGEARSAGASPAAAVPIPGVPVAAAASKGVETSLIQSDEDSNALIISASDAVYNNLRAVIEKLDIRRAQVYVEALIAEISSDRVLQYGIQFAGGGEVGSGLGAGFTQFPSGPGIVETAQAIAGAAAGDATRLTSAPAGLNVGFLSKKITLPDGTEIRGLGALARAFANDSHVNVLSTPNLVTLDNTEANMLVGQNVPFVTGSFAQSTGTGGTVNPFTTVQREDVGLKLKVKPQISEGGGVKLDIEQEVSSVILATALSQNGPATNKRSIKTSVVVDDGNTIVLGGLIEDSGSDSVEKVPLLGDIPLIGELFKFTNRQKKKTNLMVFLRPVIVRSEHDAASYSYDRYAQIRASDPHMTERREFIIRHFEPKIPPPEEKAPAENGAAAPPGNGSEPAAVAPAP